MTETSLTRPGHRPPSSRVGGGDPPGPPPPAAAARACPWIIPALVLSGGLIYYCIGYTGFISTLDWDGISPDPTSVGANNYARILQDPVFWEAVQHTRRVLRRDLRAADVPRLPVRGAAALAGQGWRSSTR